MKSVQRDERMTGERFEAARPRSLEQDAKLDNSKGGKVGR